MNKTTLGKLDIVFCGYLRLKGDNSQRVEETKNLGGDQLWSSDNLWRHLNVLKRLVPKSVCLPGHQKEASARMWIDPFFFRAAAMLPPSERMILSPEITIPATVSREPGLFTLSGVVDYSIAVLEEGHDAGLLFFNLCLLLVLIQLAELYYLVPTIESAQWTMLLSFFVAKAKSSSLEDHIPQAISEMVACAEQLQ